MFLIKLMIYTAGSWETIGSFFMRFGKGFKRINKISNIKDF